MPDQSTPILSQKGTNVGIGTGNPAYKLDVNGTIVSDVSLTGQVPTYGTANAQFSHKSRAGAGEYSFLSDSVGTTFINAKTGYDINFRINNNNIAIMKSGGFVGINESAPGYRLSVTDSNQYVAGFLNNVANQLVTLTVQNSALSTAGVNTGAATFELVGKAGTSPHGRHAWIGAEGVASETFRTKLLFKIRGESNSGYTWSGAAEAPTILSLDGNGQVRFNQYTSSSSFTGTAAGVLAFDSSGNIITQSATLYPSGSGTTNYVARWTGTNTLGTGVLYDNGSTVMIGDTVNHAGSKLYVNNSITTDYNGTIAMRYNVSGQTNSYYKGMTGTHLTGSPARGLHIFNYDADSNNGIQFWSNAYPGSATSPQMVITSGGLVGIGTDSPSNILTLRQSNSASSTTLGIINSSTANNVTKTAQVLFYLTDTVGSVKEAGYLKCVPEGVNAIDAKLVLGTRSGDATRESVIVSGAGNVGINTSPSYRLDVYGGASGVVLNLEGVNAYNAETGILFSASRAKISGFLNGSGGTPGTSLRFYTMPDGGSVTEQMRITSTGNVGINNNGPSFKLDVTDAGAVISGTATIGSNMKGLRLYNSTTDITNNAIGIWFATGPHQAGIASFRASAETTWETTLAFYTHVDATSNLNDATEKMRLTGQGSLGIGTSAPAYRLDVRSDVNGDTVIARIYNGDGNANTGAYIGFSTGYAQMATIGAKREGAENDSSLIFSPMLNQASVERMRIDSAGKISQSLSTGAAAFGNGINIVTSPGTYTTGHGGILQFQNEDVITAGIRGVRASGWGSAMAFYVHNASAGNTFGSTFVERMRITETGDVGIGTNAPSTRFVVYDDTQDRFNIRISSTIANNVNKYMGIGFSGEESNTKGAIFFQSYGTSYSRGKMIFALNNATDQSNATPSNAILTLDASGPATFVSYVTATAYYESSDRRIKTLLDNTIDYTLVANVEARYYEKNGVQELGYFAQDFENILPSAVKKDEKDFLNLSYTQVHTAKIAALEARVKELESQLKNK